MQTFYCIFFKIAASSFPVTNDVDTFMYIFCVEYKKQLDANMTQSDTCVKWAYYSARSYFIYIFPKFVFSYPGFQPLQRILYLVQLED